MENQDMKLTSALAVVFSIFVLTPNSQGATLIMQKVLSSAAANRAAFAAVAASQ